MTKEKNKKNSLRSLTTTCFFVLLLAGSFLFAKDSLAIPNNYTKNATSTLLATEWNNLISDFVNTFSTSTMTGPIGIGTTNPVAKLDVLFANGSITNDIRGRGIVSEYYGVSAYGGKGGIAMMANGTQAAPTAVTAGGIISLAQPLFYDGSIWRVGSRIDSYIGSVVNNTSVSSGFTFNVGTATGNALIGGFTGISEAMRITPVGNVGINNTAPNDIFSIGNSGSAPVGSVNTGHNYTMTYLSADPYALINYGTVLTLLNAATSSITSFWGGTLGSNVWNLNTGNIGINTTTPSFKFDINGTFRASSANISGLGAGVVMTDASGTLYSTSTLPSGYVTGVGVFVGASATSTTGTNNGNPGYDVAYSYCETDYANSHVCTPDEMLNSVRHGAIYPTVNVWIFSGPPGYTASANDCNGRRAAAATDLGAYWEGLTGSFPKGRGLLMACNQSLKIACCK